MLRIAFGTLRARKGGALGALAAVALAVALVVRLRHPARVEPARERPGRAARRRRRRRAGDPYDQRDGERGRRLAARAADAAGAASRRALAPGRAVVARPPSPTAPSTCSSPSRSRTPGGVVGHGWSSAALTPYALVRGTQPADAPARSWSAARSPPASASGSLVVTPRAERPVTVVGIARRARRRRRARVLPRRRRGGPVRPRQPRRPDRRSSWPAAPTPPVAGRAAASSGPACACSPAPAAATPSRRRTP